MGRLHFTVLSLALTAFVAAYPTITLFDNPTRLVCRSSGVEVPSPVWDRNNGSFRNTSPSFEDSRMRFDGSSLVFTPALPQDEGYYRCGVDASSLGETYSFLVPPYISTPVLFHDLRTSFNLPCGVTIGEVSRREGFEVTWVRYTDLSGLPVYPIVSYASQEDDYQEIVSADDGLHNLVIANLSLNIDECTVDLKFGERESVVFYECQVSTVNPNTDSKVTREVRTAVTFNFTVASRIVTPLSGPIISQPGQNITDISFTFEGDPTPQFQWSLDNISIEITEKSPHFELSQSQYTGSTIEAVLKIFNASEEYTGLLRATVGICMKHFAVSTTTHIIVVATVSAINASQEVTLVDSEQVKTVYMCGNPTLHFEIPRPIPQLEILDLQIKARFTEVTTSSDTGRVVSEIYPASEIAGKTAIDFYLEYLPERVKDFERYTVELLLIVDGTEGLEFSPPSNIVCQSPPLSATLELKLLFEDNCYSLETETDELADAVKDSFSKNCPSGCEDADFEHPELECTSKEEGTFTVEVKTYGADGLIRSYYAAIKNGAVVGNGSTAAVVTPCDTCLEEESTNGGSAKEKSSNNTIIVTCAFVFVAAIVLIPVLAARLPNTRRKIHRGAVARETDIELAAHKDQRMKKPCPLPRSEISLNQFKPYLHHQCNTIRKEITYHKIKKHFPQKSAANSFPLELTAINRHPPTEPSHHKTIGELASQYPPSHTGLGCEVCRAQMRQVSDSQLQRHGAPPFSLPLRGSQSTVFSAVSLTHTPKRKRRPYTSSVKNSGQSNKTLVYSKNSLQRKDMATIHECTHPDCPCQRERCAHYNRLVMGYLDGTSFRGGDDISSEKNHPNSPLSDSTTETDTDSNEQCNLKPIFTLNHQNKDLTFVDTVEVIKCNSHGGTYYNSTHDIFVNFPKGAIPEGILLNIEIGVTLTGPFQFPKGTKSVSPIVWLCVLQYKHFRFLKPVEITLPHYLSLRTEECSKSTRLQFMKAGHSRGQSNEYVFLPTDDQAIFRPRQNYGTLYANHFCFLCITAQIGHETTAKANYCLVSALPNSTKQPSWSAHFCVAYFLPTCTEAVRKQYPDGYEIATKKFCFSDPSPNGKLKVSFEREVAGGWVLVLRTAPQITERDMDFWAIDPMELELMHTEKMYPPRFTIRVGVLNAFKSTYARIHIKGAALDNLDEELLLQPISEPAAGLSMRTSSVPALPCIQYPGQTMMLPMQTGSWNMPLHKGYPTNQELEEVAKHLVGKLKQDWVLLQSYLDVPDHIMAEIDSDPSILRKVFKMLKMWRDHSEDGSKERLAVCLKAVSYKSLNRIANKLVSGEYNFLTPSNSSQSSSVDSSSTSGSTSGSLRREIEDTPLPKKRPRTDE